MLARRGDEERARRGGAHLLFCRVAPARGARVRLTLNGQQYTDQKVELLFYNPPTLDSEVPPSGGGAGGTSVLVYGSGFTPTPLPTDAMAMAEAAAADDGHAVDLPGAPALTTLRCRFGQVKVPATALSDSLLRCFTPPAVAAGAFNEIRIDSTGRASGILSQGLRGPGSLHVQGPSTLAVEPAQASMNTPQSVERAPCSLHGGARFADGVLQLTRSLLAATDASRSARAARSVASVSSRAAWRVSWPCSDA